MLPERPSLKETDAAENDVRPITDNTSTNSAIGGEMDQSPLPWTPENDRTGTANTQSTEIKSKCLLPVGGV